MTLPSNNNIWTILFFGGIIMVIYCFTQIKEQTLALADHTTLLKIHTQNLTIQNNRLANYNNEISANIDNSDKIIGKYNQIEKLVGDSENLELNLEKINQLNTEIEKLEIIKSQFIENEDLFEEIDKMQNISNEAIMKSKAKIDIYEGYEKGYFIIILVGSVFCIIGFTGLIFFQKIRDSILFSEYINLKVNYSNCQSCGMDFSYDDAFDKQSNYCSYCYSKGRFNHDISLAEFKLLVKNQLKLNNYNWLEIQFRLQSLSNLVRWKKKFTWYKNDVN